MSKLLIEESPLTFQPSLAVAIGINEAIVLQQVHYWINNPKNKGYEQDGYKWVYNTYAEWKETNFPFWSENTIQRTFASLEDMGLIVSIQPMKGKYDRTKYYRIEYTKLEAFDNPKSMPIEDTKLVRSLNESDITTENTTENDIPFAKIQIALEKIGILLTSKDPATIDIWLEKHTEEYIQKAIDVTQAKRVRNISYVNTILAGWLETGYPSDDKNRKAKKQDQPSPLEKYAASIGAI